MMLHPALFVLAALAVAGSAKAAEPTPDEVLDAALAVISNRAIRNGCVELEERVEIDATESHPVRRRIVFEGDILTGRFRDDYPLSPEQPASLMMRCGSAPNYITLTAIANHSNVGISSVPWVPARFGDFGRLANRNWTWEQPPALVKFAQSVQLVGKEDFEGFQIQVIEVRPWAGKNKKAWIDPARGYICPRLEVYDGETLVGKTESWGFFVEPDSKLFYPEHYRDIIFDKNTGHPHITWNYHVNPKTLKLNVPALDDEFSIAIPQGGRIQDEREGGRDYRATTEVQLAFNSKLDLDKISALEAMSAPRPKKSASAGKPEFGKPVIILIATLAGVLPLALIIFVVIVHRMSKPRIIAAESVDP